MVWLVLMFEGCFGVLVAVCICLLFGVVGLGLR